MMGLPLGFAQPLVLLGLLSLPVLWWLLRLIPPQPKRIDFPPTRLLFDIHPKEEQPRRTPWWLTALRLLAATRVILAAAGPIWNPLIGGKGQAGRNGQRRPQQTAGKSPGQQKPGQEDGKSGHIVMVVPETQVNTAKRDSTGQVTAPLQSQAGATNFKYGRGRPNWNASAGAVFSNACLPAMSARWSGPCSTAASYCSSSSRRRR